MAEKTITLPEEIVNSLLKIKRNNETIEEVLVRIIGSAENKERILEWLEKKDSNEELAKSIETVCTKREEWKIRDFS